MLIAGEASGDLLAAELVSALLDVSKRSEDRRDPSSTRNPPPSPVFFGAGGPKMSAAGVELAFDMTRHAAIGIPTLGKLFQGRRLFHQLLALAIERKPDVVIGVDYGFFNLRFGHAIKEYVRENPFSKWNPKIVQYVSPQVWASRPGRANKLAADYDLVLSIFPFEKDWYAQRVPQLRVEFVGHPMIGRFTIDELRLTSGLAKDASIENRKSKILLLPGSRRSELQRHLPVMIGALRMIQDKLPAARATMVLPNESLAQLAKSLGADLAIQIGNLPTALAQTDIAIASTGTVTMECAFFGVPTVTLYKTSWFTYQIARRIVTVKSLTMPNLLAGEEVYPEFVQGAATPENISHAALELMQNEGRRIKIKFLLRKVIASLGEPGAAGRAAMAVLSLL
jgi:lipid-A-disaccharide synthase